MSGAAVRAVGLVKTYGATRALDEVSVEIPTGVLAAVTGRSGSGKTTLLHVLSGLAAPDAGTVRVGDRELSGLGEAGRADARRQLMGFVFQRANLIPALTVAENVAVPLLLSGVGRADVRRRTGEALEQVGLADRAASMPAELSGGESQRVAVARAVVGRPQVVWADEPTGALDSASAATVLGLLRALVDAGSTVVVVTHDREVAAGADLEVVLRDGRRAS